MNEYNIDYEAMFKELSERFNALLKMDEEFFALLELANEQARYSAKAAEHFMKFKKSDQIKLLRTTTAHGAVCKALCEKYSLFDDEEEGVE